MDDFSAPTQPPAANPKKRVTLCAFCHYNLADQTEFYVPDYHLVAVKCPECGRPQPAGVVAQPWKLRRLKQTTLGTLWWMLFFILTFGTSGALYGISQSTAFLATQPLCEIVSEEFRNADDSYKISPWGDQIQPSRQIGAEWWEEIGIGLVRKNHPVFGMLDWTAGLEWLWFLLICPISAQLLYCLFKKSNPVVQIVILSGIVLFGALLVLGFTNLYYGSGLYPITPHRAALELAGYEVSFASYIVGVSGWILCYLLAPNMSKLLHRILPTSPRPR